MTYKRLRVLTCLTVSGIAILISSVSAPAQDKTDPPESVADVATQLAGISSTEFLKMVAEAQESVVVVQMEGRDGKPLGIGSGFVVSEDGLIATNLHVIGEARPIRVKMHDDRQFTVTEVHGVDKTQDVALIRIPAQGLTPLKLGNADGVKQGQPVFALGNPWGLEHSVVTGVVSGFRDNEDGMSLIQLAIPIEQGNSGGPLLDMQGRVHGLLTLKSQVTENLGYAVKADAVRKLLESPNPIPMTRWMTIGTLNAKLWEPGGDVNWRHRAGTIHVDGISRGFGGRALCLYRPTPPEAEYDLAVDVKIEEADGAAGLVFHSDGEDLHFGFYPSNGNLRISRFDGPTVYSWNVLQDVSSRKYRPGEWNRLKVSVAPGVIKCYCNDEFIFEHSDPRFEGGRVGLVKFRHTTAQFKRFEFADELPSELPSAETVARIEQLSTEIDHRRPPTTAFVKDHTSLDASGLRALQAQARVLEEKAEQLRRLAKEIHEQQVRNQIVDQLDPPAGGEIDLLKVCLLIAALDNHDLDMGIYENQIEQMAEELKESYPEDASEADRVDALNEYFFERYGFHGSHTNYYHASNSYINEVIDDREGLPLTLSIVYVEVARRVGIPAAGIGLPGHFIARITTDQDQHRYIDVFEAGQELSVAECRKKVREFSGFAWDQQYLEPQPPIEIAQRMLRNLIRVANESQDLEAALRYVRTILALNPDSVQDRLYHAVLCYNTGRIEEGIAEVDQVLKDEPEEIELQRVRDLRSAMMEKLKEFE